ncbi:MAG: hypothetical protein ACI9MR_004083, partial [Myxococcota bacterium]
MIQTKDRSTFHRLTPAPRAAKNRVVTDANPPTDSKLTIIQRDVLGDSRRGPWSDVPTETWNDWRWQ